MHSTFWQNVLIGWSQRLNFWNQSDSHKFSVFFSTKTFNFLVIPFSDTGILFRLQILFCLLLPFASSCLSSLLLAYLIFSKFVSLLLIDQSQSLTEILPTYLVLWLLCIYERLCLTCPRFLYVWLFKIIFLFLHCEPFCPNLSLFWHFFFFFLYDRDSSWTNVLFHSSSKRWVFFFFFLLVTSLPVLKFWVIIFFSLLLESMIGIYAWLSLRKQHQTPRYFLSLFWHSLSFDSLQPVFEMRDRVRSLITTKLCVWFPRLLPTLGLVWISDIWSYPLTIRLV